MPMQPYHARPHHSPGVNTFNLSQYFVIELVCAATFPEDNANDLIMRARTAH